MQDGPADERSARRARRRLLPITATPRRRRRRTRARSAFRRERTPRRAGASKTCRSTRATWQAARRGAPPRGARRRHGAAQRAALRSRSAHRRALRPRSSRGDARAGIRGRSRQTAKPRRSTKSCSSRGNAPTRSSSTQRQVLARSSGRPNAREARSASACAGRRATRTYELGVELLEEALRVPIRANEAAFTYLRELWGTKEGNWDRVVELAGEGAQARASNGSETVHGGAGGDVDLASARQPHAGARLVRAAQRDLARAPEPARVREADW